MANIFKKNIENNEATNIGKFHRLENVALNRHVADMTHVKILVVLKRANCLPFVKMNKRATNVTRKGVDITCGCRSPKR